MEVLQAKNLKKIYGSGNNAVHALDGVDLSGAVKIWTCCQSGAQILSVVK